MIEKLSGKKVNIGVAFMNNVDLTLPMTTKHFKGIVATCSTLSGENFIVFEDGTMINMKYVQTIEFI